MVDQLVQGLLLAPAGPGSGHPRQAVKQQRLLQKNSSKTLQNIPMAIKLATLMQDGASGSFGSL